MKKRIRIISSFSLKNKIKEILPRKNIILEITLWLVVLTVSALLLQFGYMKFLQSAYPLKYSEFVNRFSSEYGFEPSLIFALIHTESGFDPNAVSHANAIGLMQINEDTFQWAQMRTPEKENLPVEMLYDPEINIKYGIIVLSLLREEFKDTETMLAAYNAGIGNVRKWLKNPEYSDDGIKLKAIPFWETEKYIKKVPATKRLYEKIYDFEAL